MLEKIRSERRWQWAAYGKHPAAKDYFKVGQDFPLLNSFSGWIENGYQVLASKNNPIKARRSWRFWTRESRKENLVCGIVRDSNDSLGRPYPLLIIGTGPLKDWLSQWDLVPLACEKAWGQMEYLSAKTFGDLRELEEEVQDISPPAAEWLELARKRESFEEIGSLNLSEMGGGTSSLTERMECFIPLDQVPPRDPLELIWLMPFSCESAHRSCAECHFHGGNGGKAVCRLF